MDVSEFYSKTCLALYEFQKNGELCDFVVKGGDDKKAAIHVHRAVLASRSLFFRTMFTTNMCENQSSEATFETFDSCVLKKLIRFCYTGDIMLQPDDLEQVLSCAHMLGLHDVTRLCFIWLQNNLDAENYYRVGCLAHRYGLIELKKAVDSFILKNFHVLANTEDFLNLPNDQLIYIISNEKLNVPCEEEVYEAVIKWVKHRLSERKGFLKDLLKHVRFPMLTRKFLIDTVTREDMLIHDLECRRYLYNALDYHLVPERRLAFSSIQCLPRCCSTSGLYVIGGENRTGALDSVELFDVKTKTWQYCAPLTTARKYPAVVTLNGHIFVLGGIDGCGVQLNLVERYDPLMKKWSEAAPMRKCQGALSVSLLDGWIYAVGGTSQDTNWKKYSLNSVERYDPALDKWSTVQPMKHARSQFDTGILNNKLYAVGGFNNMKQIDYCEMYDPLENTWSSVADLNKPRMDHGTVVYDEKLFAIGGVSTCGTLDCIEKYNRGLNMWLIIKHTLDPRTGASISLFNTESDENSLFIVGGIDESYCYHSSVKQVNLKSIDYTISHGKSMIEPRAYGGIAAL